MSHKRNVSIVALQWGKTFDPLLILYVCSLTKKDQSIILIVGLFEQWVTEQQQKHFEKMHLKKVIN